MGQPRSSNSGARRGIETLLLLLYGMHSQMVPTCLGVAPKKD